MQPDRRLLKQSVALKKHHSGCLNFKFGTESILGRLDFTVTLKRTANLLKNWLASTSPDNLRGFLPESIYLSSEWHDNGNGRCTIFKVPNLHQALIGTQAKLEQAIENGRQNRITTIG